ncbi:MAG: hypothetical protein EPO68_00615 [Planctomycetota bacterium]|nr:MAG: hypothetical protein EPO68_00615 [Planctomycetota bacterium]
MSGDTVGGAASGGDTRARALRFALAVGLVLAFAAWCWRDLLAVSFTGEDLGLIQDQRDGYTTLPTVFRPLWHAWFWLGGRLFGAEDPRPWHAAQLALHLANAALVAAIARALRVGDLLALAACALFALGAGCADSVCWIAATNRQLSGFGALVCVLGLLCAERESVRWPRALLLALAGLLFQYGSNEEVYGTALFASAWLGARALRGATGRRVRAWAIAGAPLLLLALHFAFLRGGSGSRLVGGSLFDAVAAAPRHALERLREIAGGWVGGADELDALAVVVLGLSLSWMQRERMRALLVGGWLLASFVPFALESGSRYRDYPTLAPLAIAAVVLVDSLLRYVPADPKSARLVPTALALAASLVGGWRERSAALEAWHGATREFEACRAPLFELARTRGAQPPILVNLELGTRALLREFPGIDVAQLLEYPALAFLDTPHACAPPPELDALAADPRGLWGRRADGSHGAIDAAALVARPRVEPWKLYARIRLAASYADARAQLAAGAVDPREVALIEAPLGTLDESGEPALGDDETVAPVAPLAIDRATTTASIALDVRCARERWLVAQHPLLYWELLRFSPEYERLGRVADPRAVRLRATIDGVPVDATFRAQGCGFALRVPAGAHRVELAFVIEPVELSAR